jgi:hypothetical protein
MLVSCNTNQTVTVPLSEEPKIEQATQEISLGEATFPEACIPPIGDFVYSSLPDPTKPVPGEDLVVPPPPPWEMVIPLPEGHENGNRYLTTRDNSGVVEIWVEQPSGQNSPTYDFFVYNTDTQKWETVSAEIEDSGISVGKLFVAKDGSLWGQTGGQFVISSPNWKSAVVKYNEKTNSFEFVKEAYGIAAGRTDENDKYELPYWSTVLEDSEGMLWVLVNKDAIYSFDPISYQVNKHANISDVVISDAAISTDGDIYYLKDLNYFDIPRIDSISEMQIDKFSPETGKIEQNVHIDLEPWPFFSNMLFDHKGRLWLDGVGFREPDGAWYQLQRSSIFVTNKIEDSIDNRWKPPSILMESSDGRIWFRSSNGTAWLDLEKEQWCWFTTYQSNIVEDSEHNLWMIADGKLYKNSLAK